MEAFALFAGLLLLQHGWPQAYAVSVLRRVRPELQQHHTRILIQDRSQLFNDELIRQRAQPGDL
ncbi:MAG: hypothetical protein ACJ8D9_08410, partial [Xanthobacteraceae bacterium]